MPTLCGDRAPRSVHDTLSSGAHDDKRVCDMLQPMLTVCVLSNRLLSTCPGHAMVRAAWVVDAGRLARYASVSQRRVERGGWWEQHAAVTV